MSQVLGLTVMLLKAYVRDFTALFFSFVFPLMFMLIFGALNFGTFRVSLGIADEAANADSGRLVGMLRSIETFRITTGSASDLRAQLEKGDRDLVLVIPADFRLAPVATGQRAPVLTVLESKGSAQEASIGTSILNQLVDQLSFAVTGTQPVLSLRRETVDAVQLSYVDFLTPGIIGMTIMQIGISSVAFGFVSQKQRGVLRRIMATPISKRRFLAAHVIERLLLTMVQVLILLAVGVFAFKVQVVGSIAVLLLVAALGSVLFLCQGFALAGWATSENQVAPVSQILTLPQLFLSGVFFGRDAVPAFVRPVADLLPLTFLNEALRAVATNGATLGELAPQLIGLAVWTVVSFVIALRLFRFET